ncbi:Alpha/beta hydrolase [Teratosphaeria destructans]|uniref:Alpha/beta hydrolase n=1 Tax=Teratosphaeria destructans TaxID=418781 RepID=A0A9W7SX15_9PEZI|nr:Alpha/beta hydrolase [Teratosphaeria destructans]
MSTPPTIILLHDAFHQAAHYIDFDAALQAVGLSEVRIPQLPSCARSRPADDHAFDDDVQVARKMVLSCLRSGRDVMVLAHGYGGKVVAEALGGVPVERQREHVRVLGVVFVAGMVCEEGESGEGEEEERSFVKSEGSTLTVTDPTTFLFNTLADEAVLEKAVAQLVPFARAAHIAPVKTAGWSHYPCAYVQCLQDQASPITSQTRYIAKLQKQCGWAPAVAKLDCDHNPFLSKPEKLAELVKSLVDDALE